MSAMKFEKSNEYGFSHGNEEFSENQVEYFIHESGTSVYDKFGNLIGEYPTESEAVEAVREMEKEFYDK